MAKVKGDVLKDPILKRIVEVIVKEIDPDKIILFGSRARGDYKEHSDYDILVLKRGIKPEERKVLTNKVIDALFTSGVYSYASVDIIIISPEMFQKLNSRWDLVFHYAYKEGKVVYEKGRG